MSRLSKDMTFFMVLDYIGLNRLKEFSKNYRDTGDEGFMAVVRSVIQEKERVLKEMTEDAD